MVKKDKDGERRSHEVTIICEGSGGENGIVLQKQEWNEENTIEQNQMEIINNSPETYHKENRAICHKIANKLEKYGIITDLNSGIITYGKGLLMKTECEQLYLLRHAETIGTSACQFMSSNSENSYLTEHGKKMLLKTIKQIEQINLDCIIYSDIPRVKESAEIVFSELKEDIKFINIPWMIGIDNSGWEGKTKDELKGIDENDFFQREVKHNIFAKSSRGCSWGQVLVRCIDLIEYLNENHKGEKVLLISQGSILMGIQIILGIVEEPWTQYNAERFFGLQEEGRKNYGRIQKIYAKEKMDS